MKRDTSQPWGRLTGLLAACGATVIGITRDLDPDVILLRALVSGLVVGVVAAAVGGLLLRMIQDE